MVRNYTHHGKKLHSTLLDRSRLDAALAGGATGCAVRFRPSLLAGSWSANGQSGVGWHRKDVQDRRVEHGRVWDAALRVAFLVLRAMRLGSTGRQQSRYSLHKLVWRTWMERSRLRCMSLAYLLAGWAIC